VRDRLTTNFPGRDGEAVSPGAVVLVCTVLVGGLILVATTYKVLMLRGGGGVVARAMGGTRVDPSTRDPLRRRLVNVVEEMAIASGVPAPEIYVLENETAMNAFSAGHSPSDAAVAVTAGMLRRLNREQLQAVVAHEFSHVLNGDMRLSIRLMGLNFGLLVLMLAGRLMLKAGGGNRRGKAVAAWCWSPSRSWCSATSARPSAGCCRR
jgi:Zn-dependent protease with chaperone function